MKINNFIERLSILDNIIVFIYSEIFDKQYNISSKYFF